MCPSLCAFSLPVLFVLNAPQSILSRFALLHNEEFVFLELRAVVRQSECEPYVFSNQCAETTVVRRLFNQCPAIDIDSMERREKGQHPPDKREIAAECEIWLPAHGVRIVAHPLYGGQMISDN